MKREKCYLTEMMTILLTGLTIMRKLLRMKEMLIIKKYPASKQN
jgi:hypothetical protein